MRYVVQRVPARGVAHLHAEVPGLVEVVDAGEGVFPTFLRALREARGGPLLRLEDDVDLARDFVAKVEAAVATDPATMTSFFTLRRITTTKYLPGSGFLMSQAVYFPPGLAEAVAAWYEVGRWREREAEHPSGQDVLVADYLKAHRLRYRVWVPNLVQHRVGRSAIDPRRSSKRQSRLYVAD